MKLDSNDRTLREILNTYFFFIPRFQRPYSWEVEQVEELWEDAIQESGPDYFIGSMVVYRHGKDTVAVIDGQQRLTTLMMLLCAIRDAAAAHGHADLADGTHTSFVEHADEDAQVRFVITTETSFPFLQDEVLSRGKPELDANVGREELAIKAAYDRITEYVKDAVATVTGNPTLSEEKRRAGVGAKLRKLRDKLLDLRLVFVEVGDRDDATTIFVTLNSRGKDLEPADLVKAHLLQLLPTKSHLDRPLRKWESIIDKFDASATSLNMTDFLLAVWRSRYGATTAKKLHKDVRRQIKKQQAESFLDELVADADLFRQINEPDYRKWDREAKDAAASLRFFRDFGIKQPMPLLLSLIREYDTTRISAPQLIRALRAVENYHFTWNILAHKTSPGGMSLFFGRYARELLQAVDTNARGVVINNLCGELKKKRPTAAELDEAFGELRFTDDYTSEKKVVQYTLERMYKHASPKAAIDFSHMTIEHLASQSAGGTKAGRIGNLIYVSEALNGRLDSKPWPDKRKILRAVTDQWIPDEVKEATSWEDAEIGTRTGQLAELARTKVWRD
jgi:Protein of unknown function DUF262/Protein of unknown function (DUF1524)